MHGSIPAGAVARIDTGGNREFLRIPFRDGGGEVQELVNWVKKPIVSGYWQAEEIFPI